MMRITVCIGGSNPRNTDRWTNKSHLNDKQINSLLPHSRSVDNGTFLL